MASASETLVTSVGVASAQGPRPDNQDFAAALSPPGWLIAAVADGVGGAKGGRVAAEASVRLFLAAMEQQAPLAGVKANAVAALSAANRWVHAQGQTDPALLGMACTFTALVLHARQAHAVHVGDSRLYRLRDGQLARLTQDHVPARSAMPNMLTRALGAEADLRIDYVTEAVRVHDRYLLCSDGIHAVLSDRAIRDALDRRDGAALTAEHLAQAALAAGSGDNATALVADVLSLPEPDRSDLEADLGGLPIVATPKAGAEVDGFRLDKMISDTRYSRVFRAVRLADQQAVIVKFPKPEVGAEAVLRLAFLREAWIAARLRSPWIAEVIEPPAESRSCLYTVMPFYDGETLEQRLARPPSVGRAEGVGIAVRLAKAVAALHRAGVIHRDIKPENVMLLPGGGLRLIDLGVARLPNIEDFPASSVPGTPSYMAPELIAGAAGNVSSDLFALGVTLFRMWTGTYPYGEVEAFQRPRFNRPAASLEKQRPELPSWLDQVLRRLIALRPEERFEDALEVVFALEHGELHATPSAPGWRPLVERDPVRFWQVVSAVLAIVVLALASHR